MQEIIIYVFVLVLFEIYESMWQAGSTLQQIIANIYSEYKKGLLSFFFHHPNFIYSLYVGIKFDLSNVWFLTLLFLKFFDIAFKLVVAQKIEENRLAEVLPLELTTPIPKWMGFMNVVIYPVMLYLAFK